MALTYLSRYGRPLVLCAALCIALLWTVLTQRSWYYEDVLLSRDQQGVWYFKQGKYLQAAQRFENLQWKAHAYYAAEQFEPAYQLFVTEYDARAYFKRANAMAHQQQYTKAGDFYAMAIALQPDFFQAQENLALVSVLAKKNANNIDKDSHTKGGLAADDVVFDLKAQDKVSNTAAERSDQALLSHERHAVWLKGLRTTPASFLQQKFYFQYQAQISESVDRANSAEETQ